MPARLFLILPALVISATASAGEWPGPLEAALAASTDGPLYAYEMIYDDGEVRAEGTVDVSQPEGQRIIVTSPAEDQWPEGFAEGLADMDAEADGDIWCADFEENVPGDVTLLEENETTATYGFTPNPDADADNAERKMFRNLKGTITVAKDQPAVLGFHLWAEKSFKPMIIARINVFDMAISCERAPDGRTYAQAFNINVEGSAMGQAFSERESRMITRLLRPIE